MGKRGSLLEAAFKDEKIKHARVSKELSITRAVQKCIVDNFKGFTDAEIDGVQHDNMTLRARLLRDKGRKKDTGAAEVVMGARYYKELRLLYSSSCNPIKQLAVTDGSTPAKEVFAAMVAAMKSPCNRGPMINYLATSGEPNMAEAIGIMKWCLELNPVSSTEQLRGVLEVMKWVSRHKLKDTYTEQLKHLDDKFNEALVQAQGLLF